MSRRAQMMMWLAGSAAAAALTAWGVLAWHTRHDHGPQGPGDAGDSEERFHAWVHEQLALTEQQERRIDGIEQAFAGRRRELRSEMRAAGDALRSAILRDKAHSPAVEAAVDRLAAAQAALQRETLAHMFQMAAALDAEQRDKLIQWTHDSLQPAP